MLSTVIKNKLFYIKFVVTILFTMLSILIVSAKNVSNNYLYINDDTYFTYYPNDCCKNISINAGEEVTLLKYKNKINGFVNVIYKGKYIWIKEKSLSEKPTYVDYSVIDNGYKRYMDWECITDSTSDQYKLQYTSAYTSYTGIRMVGNRYCIAVGTYFTSEIGKKIDVTLQQSNGENIVIRCITGDIKDNKDTDAYNIYASDGSLTEFLVNTSSLPEKARIMGDVSYVSEELQGTVKNIRVFE